jgi:hypothetical protein
MNKIFENSTIPKMIPKSLKNKKIKNLNCHEEKSENRQ